MLFHNATICLLTLFAFTNQALAKGPEFNLNAMDPPQLSLAFPDKALAVQDTLVLRVQLDSGWHINANVVNDEFLFASRLDAQANGIQFAPAVWPTPEKSYNDALQMESLFFSGNFVVKIPVSKLEKTYDSLSTKVTLHYQSCSNSICLAPTKAEVGLSSSLDLKKNGANTLAATNPNSPASQPFLLLLFFAFVGGLILNLMPCVLPVLSIKALSLAKHARESRRKLLAFGLSMTLGILVSFWTLATVILIVKAAGGAAGWGFQFQNAGFLVGMTVLTTLLALNLFGVFEIWLPSNAQTGISKGASRKGLVGSFLNGVLMTLLSTPCSAPFLGSAMGFAFSQPPVILLLFFTSAGLGLAFPYLMLSIFPSTLRWIPKPGDWMVRFKQFLGFLMLVTAAWLLWVVGRQAGLEAMGMLLLLLITLGFGAWMLGIIASPGSPFWKVAFGWVIVGSIGFAGWLYWINPLLSAPIEKKTECAENAVPTPDADGWIAWSPATQEALLAQGKTLFVDYTADWCITCKTNEKAVLGLDTIRNAFEQLDVVLLRADFTKPDPEISKSLKYFNRSGVPLYVVYSGQDPSNPIVLAEILTIGQVIDALMKAGPSR